MHRTLGAPRIDGTRVAVLDVMMTPHLTSAALAACLALAATACTSDDGGALPSASLRVVNDSDFVIEEIYLTATDDPDWGPNLLRGDVLFPDEELLLGVTCDLYDALVVDEDGVECEIDEVDLCLNDATWVIRNTTCTVWDAARRARGAIAAPATTAL